VSAVIHPRIYGTCGSFTWNTGTAKSPTTRWRNTLGPEHRNTVKDRHRRRKNTSICFFSNRKINCLVAVELKAGPFEAEPFLV